MQLLESMGFSHTSVDMLVEDQWIDAGRSFLHAAAA